MPEMTMRTTQTARLMLLSGVATAALMGPAMALDAQTFVDRVAAFADEYGYELEFGAATLDGDTVTVDGLTMTVVTAPGEVTEPMVIDTEITFSGVVEGDDGSYTAASITVPDIDTEFSSEPVGRVSVRDIELAGLYIPADPVPAVMSLQWLASASSGPLVVTRDGKEVFSIASMESTATFNPAQGTVDLVDLHSPFAINGIKVDLSAASEEDPAFGATIEQLGLTTISGDITGDMSWSMADGHLTVNEFLFDFADVGALDFTFDITGFTPAVLDKIYAMQASMMAGSGEPTEEQAQAQMMQGMALMQGVNIVGASLRYDDASIAGKLLDFFAASSGTDRATFVDGLKGALPAMVQESGVPELVDLVVPPVSTFLDDPQSLEVKVAPPSPTSLLVLMAAAANPAGLITALGFTVEANSPAE